VQDHFVADSDVADSAADGVDPAGILVPDCVGKLDLGFLGPLPFEDVQIGAADAGGADFDNHIQGVGDRWFRGVGELEVFVVADYADDFHGRGLGVVSRE
jgi:hypothetical protein